MELIMVYQFYRVCTNILEKPLCLEGCAQKFKLFKFAAFSFLSYLYGI